jgi:ketosteroid isomerase-like protein
VQHLGFRLVRPGDIDAAAAAVRTAGGEVIEQGEFVPGEPYLFARDPDGYVVEIWFERPTSADPPARPGAAVDDHRAEEDDMDRREALTATAGLLLTPAAAAATTDADVLKLLDRFAAAWNRHDVDGLMACMADECVFEASSGPEVAGARHVGRDAVRRAYADVFAAFPDARWNEPRHFVAGDRAVSEWRFTGTTTTGARVEVNGCDVFTLRGGKIAVKNSYRKQRTS